MSQLTYLLDTNVLSESIRPRPHLPLVEKLEQQRERIATASVVWHELLFGCQRLPVSHKRQKLEKYLYDVVANLPILPYTKEAAEWHAQERVRLTTIGKTPPFLDAQIAAIAKVHELVLVTANVADYKDFAGLVVEDWRIGSGET